MNRPAVKGCRGGFFCSMQHDSDDEAGFGSALGRRGEPNAQTEDQVGR
jgi:hypothetical protein